jgi:hypothetical protein
MQNLCAKNIVDSISTGLCSFCTVIYCVTFVQIGAFLPDITPRIKCRCVMSIAANCLKTSFNYKNILRFRHDQFLVSNL